MAKVVVTAGYIDLGAVDYSAQVKSATLTMDAAESDVTNMDSAGWKEAIGGLKSGSLAIEFVKDAVLSGLDAAVNTAFGSTLTFELRQSDAAVSASNPKYTGSVLITQWSPVAGGVGEVFGGSVTWPVTGAITRATS